MQKEREHLSMQLSNANVSHFQAFSFSSYDVRATSHHCMGLEAASKHFFRMDSFSREIKVIFLSTTQDSKSKGVRFFLLLSFFSSSSSREKHDTENGFDLCNKKHNKESDSYPSSSSIL